MDIYENKSTISYFGLDVQPTAKAQNNVAQQDKRVYVDDNRIKLDNSMTSRTLWVKENPKHDAGRINLNFELNGPRKPLTTDPLHSYPTGFSDIVKALGKLVPVRKVIDPQVDNAPTMHAQKI